MRFHAVSLLCCVVVFARGQENFQLSYVSDQMDDYCRLRGRAEGSGIYQSVSSAPRVGKSGPRGPKGAPGRTGNVDYSRVTEVVEEIVDSIITDFRHEIASLGSRLNITLIPVGINPEHCKVQYRGKCFWAVNTRKSSKTVFNECTSNGGHPANIYDDTHLKLLQQYVSTISRRTYDDYFTGMTYDPLIGSAKLHDGSSAPYLKWLVGAPLSNPTGTMIMFDVQSDASSAGMWNLTPHSRQEGVLCEKDY